MLFCTMHDLYSEFAGSPVLLLVKFVDVIKVEQALQGVFWSGMVCRGFWGSDA